MTTGRPLLALLLTIGIVATVACQRALTGASGGQISPSDYTCCPNLDPQTLSGNTPDQTGFSTTPIALVNSASSGDPIMPAPAATSTGGAANQSAPAATSSSGTANQAAAPTSTNVPQAFVNGTVQSVSPTSLQLSSGESYGITPSTRVVLSRPGTPADLTTGQFVAITAIQAADGSLLASIVSVFPESQRGLGEGQRPMTGDNLMTNATVEEAQIAGVDGGTLTVAYNGTTQQVQVPPSAEITVRTDGTLADVQAGKSVTVGTRGGGNATSITLS